MHDHNTREINLSHVDRDKTLKQNWVGDVSNAKVANCGTTYRNPTRKYIC